MVIKGWSRWTLLALSVYAVFVTCSAVASEKPFSPTETSRALWVAVGGSGSTAAKTDAVRFLSEYFDFARFAEGALWQHWPRWTLFQRLIFLREFSGRLAGSVGKLLTKKTPKDVRNLHFSEEARRGSESIVRITATYRGETYEIRVYLIQRPSAWRIYDYDVEGANLTRNWRAQFNKTLRKEGFSGLIRRLRERT